jgi:hypothetical protein
VKTQYAGRKILLVCNGAAGGEQCLMAKVQTIKAANGNRSTVPGIRCALSLESFRRALRAYCERDSGLACERGEWRGEKESMTECHGLWRI